MRLDSIIATTKAEPRPYQSRIVQKTVDMYMGKYIRGDGVLEPKIKSIIIESACGSGKTIMAMLTAKVLQNLIDDLVIGWVAMRRNLLSQAKEECADKHINLNDIHYISMFDHYPEELVELRKQGRPILLVVDECAHDATDSMAHIYNLVKPDLSLGLSATPFRTDRAKLCFEKRVTDAGIHALIQDGYLSKYEHYTIDKWCPKVIAERFLSEPERWGKSIFYFHEHKECHELQNLLAQSGVLSEVVTGDSDRDAQLKLFKNGDVNVLINCMVLTEGFNECSLKTAWVRDSGRGTTIQMGGRAFRKFPTLPIKQIVQSKLTRWPFVKTAMPEQQFLWMNSGWRSLRVNPFIEDITQAAQQAIASIDVQLPTFIVKHKSKKKLKMI